MTKVVIRLMEMVNRLMKNVVIRLHISRCRHGISIRDRDGTAAETLGHAVASATSASEMAGARFAIATAASEAES